VVNHHVWQGFATFDGTVYPHQTQHSTLYGNRAVTIKQPAKSTGDLLGGDAAAGNQFLI
jgi:hypothetical protein